MVTVIGIDPDLKELPVPGLPGWTACEDGNIFFNGYLRGAYDSGRVRVRIGNNKKVFRAVMVCSAFHGSRPGKLFCLHKNDIPDDDRPENLYWGTPSNNMQDRAKNGWRPFGELNSSAKLTARCIQEIKLLHATGNYSQADLAYLYNVTKGSIAHIIHGRSWSEVCLPSLV